MELKLCLKNWCSPEISAEDGYLVTHSVSRAHMSLQILDAGESICSFLREYPQLWARQVCPCDHWRRPYCHWSQGAESETSHSSGEDVEHHKSPGRTKLLARKSLVGLCPDCLSRPKSFKKKACSYQQFIAVEKTKGKMFWHIQIWPRKGFFICQTTWKQVRYPLRRIWRKRKETKAWREPSTLVIEPHLQCPRW